MDVLIEHITYRIGADRQDVIPGLGETWGNICGESEGNAFHA